LNWAEHTVEIDAPIETCYAAIIDYETFPKWQGAVVDTEVLDWDSKGRGKRVRLFVDAKVRKVDYTLDYSYDEPTLIEWDFVEGNGINAADGNYVFEDLGGGRTRATYKLGLEVGIPLPGPVARRAHKSTLKGSVEDLKREAERRAASAAPSDGARAKADAAPSKAPPADTATEREAVLAEKAGIRQSPRTPPRTPAAAAPERDGDGGHSIVELPVLVIRRGAGLGVRVTRRAAGAGLEVGGAVTSRAARILRRFDPTR